MGATEQTFTRTLYDLGRVPEGVEYSSGDKTTSFDEYDLESLPGSLDVGAYWYKPGSYEGSGHMVYRVGGKWNHHDCGHCSCYGPTEHISDVGVFDSLDHLRANCSKDLIEEGIDDLISLLKEKGYN